MGDWEAYLVSYTYNLFMRFGAFILLSGTLCCGFLLTNIVILLSVRSLIRSVDER